MLTMECPNCKEVIRSHLLGEIKVVFCKHCKTNVPVQDVHISASVYTMRREDLLNRIYRYGKLLVEAEK
ncbi:MAG: hypothetical protein HY265_06260, partial [Deltaproteobacteria bacterium]|nr:hypothetical protein [Deltaproteobacteria bacterium]